MFADEGVIFDSQRNEGTGEKGGLSRQVQMNDFNSQEDEKKSQDDHQDHVKKFDSVVQGTNKVLLNVKAVFPFDFFPDRIIIDPNKVNVVRKSFFLTEKLHSISIKNITDVYVQTAPFFASLHIMDNAVADNVIIVKYLWKKDAEKARRVIQGLIEASKHEVDIHTVSEGDRLDHVREKLSISGRIPAETSVKV